MIRNIYCVGRNYVQHAAELGNAVPENPMIFMKPSHAAALLDGGIIKLPSSFGSIHYETELVVKAGKKYEPGMKAQELIDSFALGIDFTLRDVQDTLKKKQHPWLKAKGFRASAPMTGFRTLESFEELASDSFSLLVNGSERQRGHISEMIFDLQVLVGELGEHYGLDEGDVIFTGTPAGVGQIFHGDRMELYWGEALWGACTVELE